MGSRSRGRLREDANPNGNRTGYWFLSLPFIIFTLGVFIIIRFINLDLLETNNVNRRKVDLEIPISKLYDMMDITNCMSVHNFDNLPAQVVVPDLRNWMCEDFAQLLQTALGLRSAG